MSKRSPKAIGTAAETAVTRWLQDNGWPTADRQPLRSGGDQGDLIVCHSPKIVAQVKAGAMADKASPAVIAEWLIETEQQAVRAGADLAVLVVARKYRNPAAYDAYMTASDWALLLTGDSILPSDAPWPLRASLHDWSTMAQGWADA